MTRPDGICVFGEPHGRGLIYGGQGNGWGDNENAKEFLAGWLSQFVKEAVGKQWGSGYTKYAKDCLTPWEYL